MFGKLKAPKPSGGMSEDQMSESAQPAPRRKRKAVVAEARGQAYEPGQGRTGPSMGGMRAGLSGRPF